jgi:hypothetical protein
MQRLDRIGGVDHFADAGRERKERNDLLPGPAPDLYYWIEPEDSTRTIPNPERRALDKQIRTARADLAKLERDYSAAAPLGRSRLASVGR